ncbi:autotransporter outer membrane beta-barrel domain-containing protein [Enterobacterales bacterium CwR94]|nr:autotransporter outer membrane beta-barrel domain-containing protein [Enterobacterales bacterium CwR94]
MNKIFRVKWNSFLNRFDVTSELTKGKTKSSSGDKSTAVSAVRNAGMMTLGSLLMALGGGANAADISLDIFDSKDGGFSKVITGQDTLISSDWSNIHSGDSARVRKTFAEALSDGDITGDGTSFIKDGYFKTGQLIGVEYTDPDTGNTATFKAYDNAQLDMQPIKDQTLQINYAVQPDGQYVDRNLIQVQSGGALDVDVGDKSDPSWFNNVANRLTAYLKGAVGTSVTSSIFKAESSSAVNPATINYNSKTAIHLGNFSNQAKPEEQIPANALASFSNKFTGQFNSAIGQQNVSNIDELRTYNSALIAAVKNHIITPEQYTKEFQKAYGTTTYYIYQDYKSKPIAADDAARQEINYQRVAYLLGQGQGAVINVANGASIQGVNSDISIVRLVDGATLNNDGELGHIASSSFGTAVISANNRSVINNNGVIDAGTNTGLTGYTYVTDSGYTDTMPVFSGHNMAIIASDSIINNDGVINIAPNGSYATNTGVGLSGNSVMVNSGNINVAAIPRVGNAIYAGKYTIGVRAMDTSSFINDGTMYLGREAQRKTDSPSNDIDASSPDSRLVEAIAKGSFTNNGSMVIGSKTEGGIAIVANGVGTSVENKGTINIEGRVVKPAPLQNAGMIALGGASHVINAGGNINLNGINAVGMMAISNVTDTADTIVDNNGSITVSQGVDPVTKTANYGLWAHGNKATANNNGVINLAGDGAIGAHARAGGTLVIDTNGQMNFTGGKKQTGYYVAGAGSKVVDKSTTAQDASTEDSTLYRIDQGASFNGDDSNSKVIASGKNATGVLVTSAAGPASTLGTGNMQIDVSGAGATGVKVSGSAQGTLSDKTVLNLSGAGSTAGIVDGDYSDIVGSAPVKVGTAVLTSHAKLDSTNAAAGAIGYIARNGGTLDHQGTIDFTAANTTGVLVDGGTLKNGGSIKVNGTGVNILGANSTVTNTSNIEATDGLAAIRVGSGASLALDGKGKVMASGTAHGILLDTGAAGLTVKDATIEMDPVATGNAIENKAELAGIKLDNTHISVDRGAGVRTAASMAAVNSGQIDVGGTGTGLLFQNADGSTATNSLDMSGSKDLVINVSSASGKGIVTNLTGDVKSGASVNVKDAAGGAALVVGGTTEKVEQSGVLTSKSGTHAVVDLANGHVTEFINSGTIQTADKDSQAINVTTGSNLAFTNAAGGHITGNVSLSDGNNTVRLKSGSTANDINSGTGNDNYYLDDIKATETDLFTSLNAGAGSDTLNLNNSVLKVASQAMLTGFEKIALSHGSTLTLDNILLPLGDAQDDGTGTGFNIDATSTLVLAEHADTAFASHLSGAGTLAASTGGNAFDFTANNANNAFTGTLALSDATFGLDGVNTQALTNATLLAGKDSHVNVADGVQHIGGLKFDGGTVAFNTGTPGETSAKSSILTHGQLDLNGAGTVQVNAGTVKNDPVLPPGTLSLLEQDDASTGLKLAGSTGTVTGAGGNLLLKDQNGNLITDALHTQITQGGLTVANATYDYRLSSGAEMDGLYVNYGLTELELLTRDADALVLSAFGKTGNAADMSAKLTGAGDLAIDAGSTSGASDGGGGGVPAPTSVGEIVSLSNLNNDYTGKTDVRSGGLLMNNDNVLGQTSELALAAGTGFDMNGHRQTVGKLNTAAGSLVNLNGGALDITNGGSVDGGLHGAGAMNVNGGTLTVSGDNAGLSATTTIASSADVQLNSTLGLGTGSIVNNGLLALKDAVGNLYNSLSGAGETSVAQASDVILLGDNNGFDGQFAVESGSSLTAVGQQSLGKAAIGNEGTLNLAGAGNWQLDNAITGGGVLNQNGGGVVSLSQRAAQYTGDTNVNSGGLQLGSAGSNVTLASSQVNVASGAIFGGYGGTAGSVSNSGTLLLGSLSPTARAVADAVAFTVGGSLANGGELAVGRSGGAAGNTLHVAGDYVGNNGHLTLNTALGGDGSVTDKLIVDGNTSGSTKVSVNNAGGSGAKTINGIEVITVGGKSDGNFVQDGRIVAGAYDYRLTRGKGAKAANWYLTNTLTGPVGPGTGEGGGKEEIIKVYRPESGAYASNMAAANNLFTNRLHDRLGETHYVDALTGEDKVTSMWLRNIGGHQRSSDSSGQLKTQANRYVMQLGGDLAQWSRDGADRFHFGVMAGYGNQQSNSRNHLTGQKADASINGYSTGVYATWLQDNEEKSGAYVDTWAQYSWFNNTVKGDSLAAESYKSKGITASVESGYTWKVGEKNARESYYVQPQAQVIWMGVKSDDISEANGTRVKGVGDGNIQTRLGARAFIKGHNMIDDGKQREFEPFVEANWIHNTKEFGSQLNGVTVTQKGTRNIGELKVGVEGQITPSVNLWGNVGQQIGDKAYSDTQAIVGVKVNF